MKNRLALLIMSLAIMAVPMAARAQGKIGVINFSAALGSTQEGKKSMADLQKKYEPRRQEIERLQREIQALQDQISKLGPASGDDEQRRLTREVEDKQRFLKRTADDAQADYTADRDESIRKIAAKMSKVIGQYAQDNGYVLVIDDAQIPVYYADKSINLQEDMVKRYDAANPASGATASGAPSTPAKTP